MNQETVRKVLDWILGMRDFDWCSGFQDSLDELWTIVSPDTKPEGRIA